MRWLAILAAVVFAATAGAHERKPSPASSVTANPVMPVIREAPDFSLTNVQGRPVRLSALRGQPVLVAFVYTGCRTACPILSLRMARLQKKLREAKVPATLLSVTVDPQGDDAAALARFAKGFGARPGWQFLREAPARLAPVLAAYEEWTRPLPGGEIDHPARLHLVDAQGRVREIYSLAFFDEEQAFYDILTLNHEQGDST
jgi:cytochrome oxidase Cu insertion factor (SCO1/SenC/PrrC family)